jgi:hypothetical protein
MFEKIKRFLAGCVEVVAALFVFVAMIAYIGMTGIMTTSVLNELRLDTYLSYRTGGEIVLLLFLLVWAPILILRIADRR